MINVKSGAARSVFSTRRFWLLNLFLILLYFWTLSETTIISVTVQSGACTARTPVRNLTIPCSRLYNGYAGLYSHPDAVPDYLDDGPLDWLAPESAWSRIEGRDAQGRLQWRDSFSGSLSSWKAVRGSWHSVFGELRAPSEPGFIVRDAPLPGSRPAFEVQARLLRATDSAGLVLLQAGDEAGSRDGWAFVATASERRGVWWRWEDGQLAEPIAGIPLQKSALAQFKSLLHRVLIAHQAALLLMLAAWLLHTLWRRLAPDAGRSIPAPPGRHSLGTRLLLATCALVAFGLAVHIAVDVLQRIPHVQDSVTYLFQARTLARGRLSAPAPPLPQAFEQQFLLVRDGRWFGKYPPGFPALLAIGVLAGAPWLVNPLLATLAVPLLYVLARRLYPETRSVAVLAAALPLASPFFLFMSGSQMAHPAELFWMLLFMVLWLRALQKPNSRAIALAAGVALGFLFLTRQLSAVAAGIPFLAVTLLWVCRRRGGRHGGGLRQALLAGVGALPFLVLLLLSQWAVTGDPFQDPRLLYWDFDHLGFGQDIGEGQNAFQLTMTPAGLAQVWYYDPTQPPRGHSPARGLFNTGRNWQALERDLYGWLPALTFSFIWLVFLLRPPGGREWALLLLFLTLLFAYVFYWADGISFGPRYFYVALPALFVLTARGAQRLWRRLGGRSGRLVVAGLLLLLVAGAYVLGGPGYLEEFRGYNNVDRSGLTLVEQQVQTPALIFVDPGLDWWHYGALFSANSPWLDGPIVVARDRGALQNRNLMQFFPGRTAYTLGDEGLLPSQFGAP